ncbi:MAG: sodium-dependent transporter [Pseudomonadales bacterium]|nr:sodium-dependent transporter [Pseudomonadales bacterium]MDP6473204.1 sodium-dependent transporter [Pseudomonadales bacterium]MDP6826036.1 sodium-dependent transporter [Pseudomonadales bacterium]MDP6973235.1 sodium-dependent transporter [Pseudomonadales bacterium]
MVGSSHEQWSSRFGFLMAAIGFAVGLGNIWRFPYITGENGGGAFVTVYLLCAFLIGVPILMAEILIGRRGRLSPPGSMREVAAAGGRSPRWQLVGHMNLLTALIIEVTYCVVAGWVLLYLFKAIGGGFSDATAETAAAAFSNVLTDVSGMLLWTLLGLAITGSIIYTGVQSGIERAVRVLMPTLFGLLVLLAVYNAYVGGFGETLAYLFTPDFSQVDGPMVLAAIGQAFFSIGVAMAGMMTFGAYLPKHISIARSVGIIIIADTLVALVAGLVIFPAVFHNGLNPDEGVGLIFQTLPVAFSQMPGGYFVAILFFVLLSVAAITSMVGLVEPLVFWLEETRSYSRHRATLSVVGVVALGSITSILTYNLWSGYRIFGVDLNGVFDYLSNQILLPVGGVLIALFVGWFVKRELASEELALRSERLFELWHMLVRYVVPPAVLMIFVLGVT